jgi:drug/metabolite transporter (DMT)-like permease
MHPIAYVLVSGVLGVAGQLILKRGIAALGLLVLSPGTILPIVLALATNPLVILGLVVYASGTFFWLIALSRVDLSYAYPFASLNYIMVLIASWLLLGEQPSPMRFVGVVAICFGVWAIARTPAKTPARKRDRPVQSASVSGGPVQ